MIIGLTIWGERISPVFDACHMLLVADIQQQNKVSCRYEPIEPVVPVLLSEKLNELNIDVLICGAISMEPASLIESAGIKLISFISGKADTVLDSYIAGDVLTKKYIMPGCGKKGVRSVCRTGQRRGRGCGRDMIKRSMDEVK